MLSFFNLGAKVIIYFLSANFFPYYFTDIFVKIYYFGQNEEIVAQSVHILLHFRAYLSHLGEGHDPSLGPAADRPADMGLGSSHRAAWQDESMPLRQQTHHPVHLLLQQFYLAVGKAGRVVERRLTLIGGEVGADVEQVLLDSDDHRLVFPLRQHGRQKPEMRTELVDGAIGLEPFRIFFGEFYYCI